MVNLVIIRHGQSVWNKEYRFTGKADVGLSKLGVEEADAAGDRLRDFPFDLAFTSHLHRASDTLDIILRNISLTNIPVYADMALDQNDKGLLEGYTKGELTVRYGKEKLKMWQKTFDVAPPEGESLKDTYHRVVPFYEEKILPQLKEGKNVILVAHGNSLRALMMHIENMEPETIANVNIPTGQPIMYRLVPITVPEPIDFRDVGNPVQSVREYMAVSEKIYI